MSNVTNTLEQQHKFFLAEEETINNIINKSKQDLKKICTPFGYHRIQRGWGDRHSEKQIEIKQSHFIGMMLGDIDVHIDTFSKNFTIECGYINGAYYECAKAVAEYLSKTYPDWCIKIE